MWQSYASIVIVTTLQVCNAAGYGNLDWLSHLREAPSPAFDHGYAYGDPSLAPHDRSLYSGIYSGSPSVDQTPPLVMHESYHQPVDPEPESSSYLEGTLAYYHAQHTRGSQHHDAPQVHQPSQYSLFDSSSPQYSTQEMSISDLYNPPEQWQNNFGGGSGREAAFHGSVPAETASIQQQEEKNKPKKKARRRAVKLPQEEQPIQKNVLAHSVLPLEDLRSKVHALWNRKGLWVGMLPREMAAAINEIKLELGADRSQSIGQIISNITKKGLLSSARYTYDIQEWSQKYLKRTARLLKKLRRASVAAGSRGMTEEQIQQTLYLNARLLQSRCEYLQSCDKDQIDTDEVVEDPDLESRADREATRTWTTLMELHIYPKWGFIADKDIPLETIEEESRNFPLPSSSSSYYSREEVAELLRRYMMKALQRTAEEIDVFYKARNRWLKGIKLAELQSVD